jgi:hypothetical protein
VTSTVLCRALRPIESSIPSVGARIKGEQFRCDPHIAQHLLDLAPPVITVLENAHPKSGGASHAGPREQHASSSPEAQASRPKKSNTSTPPTRKVSAKSSR